MMEQGSDYCHQSPYHFGEMERIIILFLSQE